MSKFPSLENQFLIAMPELDGDVFERSVAYICEHTEKGAMALIINQPLNLNFKELLKELDIRSKFKSFQSDICIGYGGPINRHFGCVIHRANTQWKQTVSHTLSNIAITTSTDILTAIANNKGPNEVLVTLGFAGWEAGQLEQEVLDNRWLNCVANSNLLFDVKPEHRWQMALYNLGVQPHQLILTPGHSLDL